MEELNKYGSQRKKLCFIIKALLKEVQRLENNYNFDVVKLHLKFNGRST